MITQTPTPIGPIPTHVDCYVADDGIMWIVVAMAIMFMFALAKFLDEQ